jgi:hypothetical protein
MTTIRIDWTRAEIAALFDLPFADLNGDRQGAPELVAAA